MWSYLSSCSPQLQLQLAPPLNRDHDSLKTVSGFVLSMLGFCRVGYWAKQHFETIAMFNSFFAICDF